MKKAHPYRNIYELPTMQRTTVITNVTENISRTILKNCKFSNGHLALKFPLKK